ncbi:MAG: MBL fold metallo-hydrolase [Verrucomicrobia bacterium]|nr:MBL fold metallo-hydrolase [Verrucomicrobiota bacterium]
MKLTFLGTGTSVGVPAIGCDCAVCTSSDPRNRRRRASIYLEAGDQKLVVDTPPDFREQALAYQLKRVDAVLFTHSHADHVFGFDDIRRFNAIQDTVIPAYGHTETLGNLKRIFDYVVAEPDPHVYRPRIVFVETSSEFRIGEIAVRPIPVEHGPMATQGYCFEHAGFRIAYVPDCHRMGDNEVAWLQGVDVMILNALRHRPHTTHMALDESLALLERIGAKRSFCVHMCHDLDHAETEADLPSTIRLAYDGLVLTLD